MIIRFQTLITINLLLRSFIIHAQQQTIDSPDQYHSTPGKRVPLIVTESGDTIPNIILPYVFIIDNRIFASSKDARIWNRLKRDVSKVYPYSKLASRKLADYNRQMKDMTESERKKMLKQAEKELILEFKDDLKAMTLNQGRILIKLIDRETGNTSYALVKDLRGSFQAFFWQSIARIFNANLKSSYDPNENKEDKLIEDIINSIEDGTFVN